MTLFVPIENLVGKKHLCRLILEMVDFKSIRGALSGWIREVNSKYSISQAFKMLFLQYMVLDKKVMLEKSFSTKILKIKIFNPANADFFIG